jgi:hypothetical protein
MQMQAFLFTSGDSSLRKVTTGIRGYAMLSWQPIAARIVAFLSPQNSSHWVNLRTPAATQVEVVDEGEREDEMDKYKCYRLSLVGWWIHGLRPDHLFGIFREAAEDMCESTCLSVSLPIEKVLQSSVSVVYSFVAASARLEGTAFSI